MKPLLIQTTSARTETNVYYFTNKNAVVENHYYTIVCWRGWLLVCLIEQQVWSKLTKIKLQYTNVIKCAARAHRNLKASLPHTSQFVACIHPYRVLPLLRPTQAAEAPYIPQQPAIRLCDSTLLVLLLPCPRARTFETLFFHFRVYLTAKSKSTTTASMMELFHSTTIHTIIPCLVQRAWLVHVTLLSKGETTAHHRTRPARERVTHLVTNGGVPVTP